MESPKFHRVLVIAEPASSDRVQLATRSVVAFTQQLCRAMGATWSLCVNVSLANAQACHARRLGASVLHCLGEFDAPHPSSERYAPAISKLVRQGRFDYVLGPASAFGKDLLPRVAGMLDAAYVSDCIGFELVDSQIQLLRPIHAGAITARCQLRAPLVVASVRTAAFEPAPMAHDECPLEAVEPAVTLAIPPTLIAFESTASKRPKLDEAKVVVSGGRPLGAQFFEVLDPLADALGAALGATRALCDAGHAPSDLQVGQTGKIVAPDLYFAIGISGSIQHLAGMRGARTIVAINVDREAPIFDHADYGIIGDLFHVVPQLVEQLRK